MTKTLDRLGSVLVVVLATVALFSLRSGNGRAVPPSRDPNLGSHPAVAVPRTAWDSATATARFDPRTTGGGVTLLEFVDVECPFCAMFADTLRLLRLEFSQQLSIGFLHLPLRQHRFAQLGAVALECAHDDRRFAFLLDEMLARQDSIGLTAWTKFARGAGVHDTTAFSRCMAESGDRVRVIARGQALARELGVTGTPGIVIDGWLFARPPSLQMLRAIVAARLSGRSMESVLAQREDER